MNSATYQLDYSLSHREQFDAEGRVQKAKKAIAVIAHHVGETKNLTALELGCSTGFLAVEYAKHFKTLKAIDIDEPAVAFAKARFETEKLSFDLCDALNTGMAPESFDVIICSHIYEHVPSAERLMNEVERLLKPNGICYFAAGNRLIWKEPDNKLPLLSVMPKPLGNLYFKLMGRGNSYYETFYTLWGLRALVKRFEVTDYTKSIIDNPAQFEATDVITPGSWKQRVAHFAATAFYWFFPTYIWVLRKKAPR